LVINAFPTPIYSSEFIGTEDLFDSIQTEIRDILPKYENKLNYSWGDRVLTSVSITKNFLDDTPQLKQYIESHIKYFMVEINQSSSRINFIKSWVNYIAPGGYQNYHNHLLEPDLSGVYYYKTNEHDGDIMFKTDSGGLNHSKIFSNSTVIRQSPQVGKLILFPSFLEHSVELNKSMSDRISIAFNCTINKNNDIIPL
jgi:uncharacterized protein (TIGR02466 family)